jgi:hypothetical protein
MTYFIMNLMVEKKNSRLRIIILIIFLFLLAFCIFAVVMRLRYPASTLWDFIRPKKNVLIPRPPKLIESEKVTKKISAKDGGSVSVTSKKGYTYELVIHPGVYNTDPTVNLTPLEEAPFTYPEDPANPPPPPPPDPGVDVDVDPPNPPNPPDDPVPDDPDDPAPDDDPTGIEIFVFPPRRTLRTGLGGATDPNQTAADIMRSAGLGDLINVLPQENNTAVTPNEPSGSSDTPPPSVLIFTGRGHVHVLPVSPIWGIGGNHEDPPDGTGAPIDEGDGTITPDDPEGGKGEDQADQAAENSGGRCSAEFIRAVMQVYTQTGLEGQIPASNRYGTLLKECEKEILDYIRRLCESDRRLLRRQDFVNAKKLLTLIQVASPETFEELSRLETSCRGYYTIVDGDIVPGGGGSGVTMRSSIDASVCGYFDDLWKGETHYDMDVDVGVGGQHTYTGTNSFHLPARGGKFMAADTGGSHAANIGGTGINVPLPSLGFEGRFDSQYTVNLVLYPNVKVKIEIPPGSKTCP